MENEFAKLLGRAEIVDLTVTLDERYPCVYTGAPPFRHVVHNWFEPLPDNPQPLRSSSYITKNPDGSDFKGTYYSNWLTIYEHCGTHFDAPVHLIPPPDSGLLHAGEHSMYGEDYPLAGLQGPAAVIDVRPLRSGHDEPGTSPLITPDYLRQWEDRHGEFQPGDVPLFWSGWDEYFVPLPEGNKYLNDVFLNKTWPGWPAPSREAILYLIDKGVELVGTDAPTLGAAQDVNAVHYELLSRGFSMVECLAHLNRLPARGSYFVFLPPKIARSSGMNGRAIAYVLPHQS